MRKNGFFSLLATTLFVMLVSFSHAEEISVKQVKLSNGLTLILSEDHTKTEVLGMVVVKAGAKNDPKDATGMAHYQEHMLFKGTTELGTTDWAKEKPHIDRIIELYDELGRTKDDSLRSKIQKEINLESVEAGKYTILNETSALVNQMGGTNLNAGTGWDQTAYYNAFPPNQIERWIELYSHRFMNPVFRAFQSELETVYEEKNMYQDNFITSLLEAFGKNFYKKHPYGQQTIIGTTEHLKNPSLTKMYEFFNTYYVANNMAVILVGDFDTEKVLPMLEEKFGQWKSKKLPKQEQYTEQAFNGRELITGKFSPIKMALLGFRTVPAGHEDELALNVFNTLISNEKGTGVLNKLSQNGELMEAQAFSMHSQDYGADIFLAIPKLIGQKLETAENLVLDAVRKVRDGGFDDEQLEQSKKEMYVNFQLEMEDPEGKAYSLSEFFCQGKDLNELNEYPARIKALTKEDIVRVAQKYYGDNYLAFYSKMGSPKKEKLDKPNYDPVTTDTKGKSSFASKFESIPEMPMKAQFVNFDKDVVSMDVVKGVNLHCALNPKNDIFTADINFQVGNLKIEGAEMVAELMNMAGTKDMSRDELQSEFARIGCTYSFSSDSKQVELSLTGLEADLEKALELIGKLIAEPVIKKEDIKVTAKNIISGRKFDQEDPSSVAHALIRYVMYGNNAKELSRMPKKELKRFTQDDFKTIWARIAAYEADIHYAGKMDAKRVEALIEKNIHFTANPIAADQSAYMPVKNYSKNVIYFVNRKKAVQSNIFFLVNGELFSKEQVPAQKAFNSYYGGGFSGLVLQEIREYRSMAYSAWASYNSPDKDNLNNYFIGFIGTQADKTMDAIKIFNDLKKDMPKKPERMTYIKPYLAQTCITSRPDFRDITYSIEDWKKLGYESDPSIQIAEKAKTISFNDINDFYKKNLQDKPMVTMIVGDKSKIDMEELSKYGEIEFIKEKHLYTK